ncbi:MULTISPECIES: glycosyltransferase [Acinetobacter]|uniref:glycosyltransferase n=1 Tax=Acinetobacter TaxID=469 RepID=UPI0015D26DBA|nr:MULTISPECIES: glycosyltransferase [Acinetobacter]WPC31653.1 glycosyltransferase [Acinetobacter towneri]
MDQPVVSIITPCFNNHDTIIETIESVQKQTYSRIEHIIIDDGSTPEISTVIKAHIDSGQVKYLRQINQGVACARNFAVQHAAGEVLVFLDADDLIAENYVAKVVQAFQDHPESSMVACYVTEFGRSTDKTKIKPFKLENFYYHNSLFPSIISVKKQYFSQVNGYNTSLKVCEDWDLYLRVAEVNAEVYIIPEYLFFYRKHNNGSSLTDLMSRDKLTVHKAYLNLYKSHQHYYDAQLLSPLNVAYLHLKAQKRIHKILKTLHTLSITGIILAVFSFIFTYSSIIGALVNTLILLIFIFILISAKNTMAKMKAFQLNQLPPLHQLK